MSTDYATRNDTDVLYSFSLPFMVSIVTYLTDDKTGRLSSLLKVTKEEVRWNPKLISDYFSFSFSHNIA